MHTISNHDLTKAHGGNQEVKPVTINGGGNPDNWSTQVNVNIPMGDDLLLQPRVTVDSQNGVNNPGVSVIYFF